MKQLLFNPFIKIAGAKALLLGLVLIIIGSVFASLFNARFDGLIDLHFYKGVNVFQALFDQIIGLIVVAFVFFITALILGSKPRLVDLVGTFAYSRLPYVFAPLLNITGVFLTFSNALQSIDPANPVLPLSSSQLVSFVFLTILSIVLVVWLVTLYFKAWKTCSNLKGNKLVLSFIAGLLIAEILTVYLTRNFTI
ncbi:MAG: hypothetical protein PSX81_02295 [bacterium]|nr:hypothetical protein [bacterium]